MAFGSKNINRLSEGRYCYHPIFEELPQLVNTQDVETTEYAMPVDGIDNNTMDIEHL